MKFRHWLARLLTFLSRSLVKGGPQYLVIREVSPTEREALRKKWNALNNV